MRLSAWISWNKNQEGDLAGYRVYYGDSPQLLDIAVDLGLTATPLTPEVKLTQFKFYGLVYFAITAYDTSNNESGFSEIVGP